MQIWTEEMGGVEIRQAIFIGNVPEFVWRESAKTTLSKPDKDLNLKLPVIGSLVYCKSSALGHAATEAVYCEQAIPPNRSLERTIEKIKEDIGDSYFWASVDETTDRCSSCIAYIVVGKLDSTEPSSPHLIASRVLEVIQTFDEEDAVSIKESKVATSSSTVVSDLSYVKSYFGNLTGTIVSLEARDLPLIESVKIIHTIQEGVKQTPGPVASSVATKLEQVLQRSIGWRTMGAVSNILGGQITPLQEISLNSSELSNLKFCSLTSCEVERSFVRERIDTGQMNTKYDTALVTKSGQTGKESHERGRKVDCVSPQQSRGHTGGEGHLPLSTSRAGVTLEVKATSLYPQQGRGHTGGEGPLPFSTAGATLEVKVNFVSPQQF
uniref:Uncharacterized protein n=1 Tax=Timema poppense TaxID=170557 RepID=A0A7R9DFV6_TIMPO|nr:unnamed protein product [Timema poppensis]